MSKHILLVSYDERLLIARRMLLEQEGYRVSSGLGFREAIGNCKDGSVDLLILGYSIPHTDREELIRMFRTTSNAPILSLWTRNEGFADGVNYLAFSDNPNKLLADVVAILAAKGSANASG